MGLFEDSRTEEGMELEGEVARIAFRAETGYTVLRMDTGDGPVTCVGHFASISPGDRLRARGRWVDHPRYGEQFSVDSYRVVPPSTAEGVVRYLASGLIPGVGEATARRIVDKFGERALEIIDTKPNRLLEVDGLGRKRVSAIKKAWREHRDLSELMVFLESHGIRGGSALRIYRQYGSESIEIVSSNPYRLASEVWGIGFTRADRIAYQLGIAGDAPVRVRAGVKYVLRQAADEGHVFLPDDFLRERCSAMLGVDREAVEESLVFLSESGDIVWKRERVYLPGFWEAETDITEAVKGMLAEGSASDLEQYRQLLGEVQSEESIAFDPVQVEAVELALGERLAIITGGPGTGKTTIIRAISRVLRVKGVKTSLAAPTGRAAKRMSEVAGQEAKTIHRLLEYSPQDGFFRRDRDNPLEADFVIIDEASMLDVLLAASLLRALRPDASLVMVGDVDQLPPVGPGSPLRDLIDSEAVPVKRLTRIFRQDEGGGIVSNAHLINSGEFPVLGKREGDFFLIEDSDPAQVAETVVDLCSKRLPGSFGLDAVREIQVLSPMYKGDAGATNLNRRLQEALNPGGSRIGDLRFRVGDKVMQLRNNYDKMVFNGDIGVVEYADLEEGKVTLRFDRSVDYDRADLDEVTLAYAISVHKSQGSEFPCIVMPVVTQHYIMLYRNLLYTAITRAKRLVVLVGTKKALALAVRNVRMDRRNTSLAERLSG
jgi:exodeoxyribonuclease V alpha subunit